MSKIWQKIEGDKGIWLLAILLAVFSFLPVYSASIGLSMQHHSNLGTAIFKHCALVFTGLVCMYAVQRVPYRFYSPLALLLLPMMLVLLLVTLMQGTTMGNANASRWLNIPGIGIGFQTSAFAAIVLLVFLARFVSKHGRPFGTYKNTVMRGLLPVFFVCVLILPANFSTAALIFIISMILLFLGGMPLKHLLYTAGIAFSGLALFILLVMAFPNINNRVSTWKSRIENFSKENPENNYQVEKAKMAIAEGGLFGRGPGKSSQKHFLPQSTSDFIYAVIVEEYGLIGGTILLVLYLWLFIRILRVAKNAPTPFGRMASLGLGLYIIIMALINMAVAVNLIPVTGQTLPLVSAGGTSIIAICIALGIVLSVSKGYQKEEETEEASENHIPDNENISPNAATA